MTKVNKLPANPTYSSDGQCGPCAGCPSATGSAFLHTPIPLLIIFVAMILYNDDDDAADNDSDDDVAGRGVVRQPRGAFAQKRLS